MSLSAEVETEQISRENHGVLIEIFKHGVYIYTDR